jgi:dTDP-6-deoxy-L-talose 4-dehydrogenase (NAD+)
MARILLTGATGFVGSAAVQVLKARGNDLRCVVRTGTVERLAGLGLGDEVVETPDLFAETVDWWSEVAVETDMVLHAAWYAEPGKYLTSGKNIDCLAGTLRMAQGVARAGVGRFVGVGTCFEYDLSPGYLTHTTPLEPTTPYAAAKAAAYLTLREWLPRQGVSFLWARLFYLYGTGEDERRLVSYLHRQLAVGEPAELTRGEQVRDFMDVRDAARVLVDELQGARIGAVNISSGQGITVRALAESIADIYGRRDLLHFGARPENLTDPPLVVGVRDSGTEA